MISRKSSSSSRGSGYFTSATVRRVSITPQRDVKVKCSWAANLGKVSKVQIALPAIFQERKKWPHFKAICTGWLGWAMVLGSFQCRGILLLLHIVGQGPVVLVAGAGRVGYIYIYIFFFHLSSLFNVLSFGRWLNMTEILWFWLLNPSGSCQLLPRTSSISTG